MVEKRKRKERCVLKCFVGDSDVLIWFPVENSHVFEMMAMEQIN